MPRPARPRVLGRLRAVWCGVACGAAREPGWWAALGAFALLVPGVTLWPAWGDALEFTAGARVLAVLHPTGYPLQSLLAKVVAEVPVSSLARRMNALSCVAMAVAAGFAAQAAWVVMRARFAAGPGAAGAPVAGVAWAIAVAFGVVLTTGPTGRELGTTAEVYALHLAFQGALLWIALRVVARRGAAVEGTRDRRGRLILAGAFLSGLGLTHHRMIIFAVGLVGIAAVAWWWRMARAGRAGAAARHAALAVALGLAGLTPWLVLPLRASGGPVQNWGAPTSIERFLWVVRGGEFVEFHLAHLDPTRGGTMDAAAVRAYLAGRMALVRGWAQDEVLPRSFHRRFPAGAVVGSLLVLGGVGAAWLARGGVLLALLPLAGWAGAMALVFVYRIVDPNGYLLSMAVFGGVLAAAGAGAAAAALERAMTARPCRGACLGLLPLVVLWGVLHAREDAASLRERGIAAEVVARRAALAEAYAHRLFDALPAGAVLLAEGDNPVFAAWYVQFAQRARPDVAVIGASFLKEAWYGAMLAVQPGRLEGVAVGGGTPWSAREYADRLMVQAIAPGLRAGRAVFYATNDGTVLERLGEHAAVVPGPELLGAEERAMLAAQSPLPLPAARLWRIGAAPPREP